MWVINIHLQREDICSPDRCWFGKPVFASKAEKARAEVNARWGVGLV